MRLLGWLMMASIFILCFQLGSHRDGEWLILLFAFIIAGPGQEYRNYAAINRL